jgi:hypothetical protein
MRPIERIPIFLEKVNWDKLQDRWEVEISQSLRGIILTDRVKNHWLKYPDQRFGQMLINLNLLPDYMRVWIDEEIDILLDQGINARKDSKYSKRCFD